MEIYFCSTHSLLTLPIRNWNYVRRASIILSSSSFDSTYKELKRFPISLGTYFVPTFDSTYKELKHNIPEQIAPFVSSFDSTYKELKPLQKRPLSFAISSFDSTYKELKHISR